MTINHRANNTLQQFVNMIGRVLVKVPFFDWAGLHLERQASFSQIINETLSAGKFILQDEVLQFEEQLADFVGAKYAVGVSDGTNAILLGLRASGLESGDEIILPGHSFIAAAQSIHHAGCIPVPVELSEKDWLICPDSVEKAITSRTRAIMPVHVNGRICQMDRIMGIAEKFDLKIFEDSAQAMGARFDGKGAGTIGLWGTFSFYPSKTLGCFGDAGALVTNDIEIYEKVIAMRNHGADSNKVIPLDTSIWGTNSRLDNVQAAILLYKMSYYDDVIKRRRSIAQKYHEVLSNFDAPISLPPPPDYDDLYFDIYQNYEFCYRNRDNLKKFLENRGVGTIVQWGGFGIHQLDNLKIGAKLPLTDKFFKESLLLPLNHVMTDAQVDYVCQSLASYFEKK